MDIGGSSSTEHPRKRKAATAEDDDDEQKSVIPAEDDDDEQKSVIPAEDDDDEQKSVIPAEVVEGSKHEDGSIYRPDEHPLHSLYHLHDPGETRLDPMRLTDPTDICHPCWTVCRQHVGCAMMQIFSLKLSKLPSGAAAAAAAGGGPIQLYGFMAVRDLLDPLRNYVFNYSRDDPFIIHDLHSDPFVYLSGPRRGIYLDCRVLVEYDIRIKRGQTRQEDLPVIDGAATFSELTYIRGAITNRISGDSGGSMDIARALFRNSVEATVEVWVSNLGRCVSGLDLFITGFVGRIPEEIKIFRGSIGDLCVVKRFVVAVRLNSVLFLLFKVPAFGTDPICRFAFRAVAHGCISGYRELNSCTVDVKVTWSNLY